MEPREITPGDTVEITDHPFEDIPFDVSDTEEANLGVTSIFVATIIYSTESYSLTHAEGSREFDVEAIDEEGEWRFSNDKLVIK